MKPHRPRQPPLPSIADPVDDAIQLHEEEALPDNWPQPIDFPEAWSAADAVEDMSVLREVRSRLDSDRDDPDRHFPVPHDT